MKKDLELLEKAAEGVYYHYDAEADILYVDKFVERQHGWDPLNDDGDAFRLLFDAGLANCIDHLEGALECAILEGYDEHDAARHSIVCSAALLSKR